MENNGGKIPEFEFFKRRETIQVKQEDIHIIANLAFQMAFAAFGLHVPKQARKYKDIVLGKLKETRLNKSLLVELEEVLTRMCDRFDKNLP